MYLTELDLTLVLRWLLTLKFLLLSTFTLILFLLLSTFTLLPELFPTFDLSVFLLLTLLDPEFLLVPVLFLSTDFECPPFIVLFRLALGVDNCRELVALFLVFVLDGVAAFLELADLLGACLDMDCPPRPPPLEAAWPIRCANRSLVDNNVIVKMKKNTEYLVLFCRDISLYVMRCNCYFAKMLISEAFGGGLNSKTESGITGLRTQLLNLPSYCLFPSFLYMIKNFLGKL